MEDKTNCKQCLTGFCINCVGYLCKECTKYHGISITTRNHSLLMGEHLPENTDVYRKLLNTLLCKTHPEKEVQFECKDHSEFICALCVRQTHRYCNNVDDIVEVVDEARDKESCRLLLNRYEEQMKRVQCFKKRQEERLKLLRQQEVYATERQTLCQQIRESLDKIDKKYDDEIDGNIHLNRNLIQESLEKCLSSDNKRKLEYDYIALSFEHANSKQMAVLVKSMATSGFGTLEEEPIEMETNDAKSCLPSTLKASLTHVRDTLTLVLEEMTAHFVSTTSISQSETSGSEEWYLDEFTSNSISMEDDENSPSEKTESEERNLNEDIYNRISMQGVKTQTKLTSEDKIDIEQSPEKTNTQTTNKIKADVSSEYELKRCETKPLMKRKIKLTDTISSICSRGCVILPDGRFVSVNNCEIKVHDADFEFLFRYELLDSVYSLCGLNNNKIALTYNGEKEINIYEISEDKIIYIKRLPMDCYCRGITAMSGRDQCFAVLCSDEKEFTGSVEIKIINYYTSDSVNVVYEEEILIFDEENLISIMSYDTEQFLVCDDTHVLSVDMYGYIHKYFKEYKGHRVARITGLTADKEGNIYACCGGSNNVHQIKAGNVMKNRVLIEKICEPCWIVFDAKRERLVIGCEDDRIRVYKFQ